MADVHDPKTRSYNMSRVRGKNTHPELVVRKYLFSKGFRYRTHSKNLPGKPDIVLQKFAAVIMVDGCFWHGHAHCKYFVLPKTRPEWWKEKIAQNVARDRVNEDRLAELGYSVFRIFECQLRPPLAEHTLKTLAASLRERLAHGQ